MAIERNKLIQSLVQSARPVRWWQNANLVGSAWLVASTAYVLGVALATAPFRPGALGQLVDHPAFLFETLTALIAGATITHTAFALGIPARVTRRRALSVIATALFAWLGFFLYGMLDPALAPSMAGKRELCYLETITLSLPPLLLGLALLRRLYPVDTAMTGFVIGIAAGMIPAAIMQFACMYIVDHILAYHIAPIAAVSLTGGLLGSLVLRRGRPLR